MNYFAHARPFLDDPYFVAGTAVPDWLAVVDRRARVRPRHVVDWVADRDPRVASVARGLAQHFRDDLRFHKTRAFAETSLGLTVAVRDALAGEEGFRPSFLGHLLVEVFLDAELIRQAPERLEAYYAALGQLDGHFVQAAVNRMLPAPTARLSMLVCRFSAERFLWDYLEDVRLLARLDQIMRRVGLPRLPERFGEVLPAARRRVADRWSELLEGIPVPEVTKEHIPCVTE